MGLMMTQAQRRQEIAGTPAYLAPECHIPKSKSHLHLLETKFEEERIAMSRIMLSDSTHGKQ